MKHYTDGSLKNIMVLPMKFNYARATARQPIRGGDRGQPSVYSPWGHGPGTLVWVSITELQL